MSITKEELMQQTWREQVVELTDGISQPVYFSDTRPNHVIITNLSDAALYVSFDASVSKTLYQYIVAPGATKVIAKPTPFYNIFVVRYSPRGVVNVHSYQGEFTAASVAQTLDTTAQQNVQIGEVAVSQLPSLPSGHNTIGRVDVTMLPSLPPGNNKIGVVGLDSDIDFDGGLSNFKTGVMTVTGAATSVKIGTSAMAKRKQLIMLPPSDGTIYWGSDPGVTASTGIPLTAGDGNVTFDIKPSSNMVIYAVSDGTDRVIKLIEGA
ncbi:hypothetical protein [Lysinibacillus sp. NPDC047702]|uniref:hypothetical protein n=1 Tax=unclassified Lysinibacillus TaxID=2636778 RepID=UPI003D080168